MAAKTLTLTEDDANLLLNALAAHSRGQILAGATVAHANVTVDLYRKVATQVRGHEYAFLPYFDAETVERIIATLPDEAEQAVA